MIDVLLLTLTLAVQQAVGPHLPARTEPQIHALNAEIQSQLASGQFTEAREVMARWPGATFTYEVAYERGGELPPSAQGAGEEAASVWSEATNGRVKITEGSKAAVRIEFIDRALPGDPPPGWNESQVVARVPLSFGEPPRPMPRRSVVVAVAKAFGVAMGHAPLSRHGWLMGIDDRIDMVAPIGPTPTELATIGRLLDVRDELEKAVDGRIRLTPGMPKLVIEPSDVNLGIVDEGAKPRATIVLRNDGNAPIEFAVDASCRCLFLQSIAPLGPGEVRVIEPGADTSGFMGKHAKEFLIHSSDPAKPTQSIVLRFESVPEYRVVPDALQRIHLPDDGPGAFEIIVYSFPGKPLNVISATANLPAVTTQVTPFTGEVVDPAFSKEPERRTGYKVRIAFDPSFPSGTAFVNLTITTDSHRRPSHSIVLQTHKGIAAAPSSVYFGGIAGDEKTQRSIRISHPTARFKILEATTEGGPFSISTQADDSDGFGYRVTVTYNGGAKGPLVGRVILRTDHPKYPEIAVPIAGHTR